MKVGIIGGSGFVGTHLSRHLAEQGHEVIVWTRSPHQTKRPINFTETSVRLAHWPLPKELASGSGSDQRNEERLADDDVLSVDAIVNLAGETINQRWTTKAKENILNSRIETTKRLVKYIQDGVLRPKVVLNASAIGYYGTSLTDKFNEQSLPGDDFLANVCQAWEQEADAVTSLEVRLLKLRVGVVLGRDQGALSRLLMPYRLFVGGTVGSGQQWVSWIHVDDLVRLICFALENEALEGAVNGTAPRPVRMKEFGKTVGKVLHRPHWFPVPTFLLRMIFGEMSALIVRGQHVLPEKALQNGFAFRYAELEDALADLLH